MNKKYVYLFSEGNKDMRNLLGGKGANLAEMTGIGLPVPQGFTITTAAPAARPFRRSVLIPAQRLTLRTTAACSFPLLTPPLLWLPRR